MGMLRRPEQVQSSGWLQSAGAAAAMVAVSLLVMRTSTAAFSGTTENGTNNWRAGAVRLTDDDSGSALFDVQAARPGDTASRCIKVSYGGTVAASGVRLFAGNLVTTDGGSDGAVLADHLNLTVEWDSASTATFAGGCGDFTAEGSAFTGTLAQLASTHTSYSTGAKLGAGATDWAPPAAPPNTTRTFKYTWTLSPSAPDTAQGDSASARFTWEAQS